MKNLLLFAVLVTLPLLLGGCGEKVAIDVKSEELVTETKPELEGVNDDELEYRGDILYLKDSDTPYTGKTINFWENGQKRGEINVKNGKLVKGSAKFWNNKGEPVGHLRKLKNNP